MTPRQLRHARTELLAASSVIDRMKTLVADGRELYDAEPDRRAHLRYLWIVIGSRLKNYSAVLDIPRAAGQLAQAIALRNKLAYTAPERINDGRVWTTSLRYASTLAEDVAETLAALDAHEP